MLDAIARAFPDASSPSTRSSEASIALRAHADAARQLWLRLDPTTELDLLLLAEEYCPPKPAERFEACARFILERNRFALPTVAPARQTQ
jgi:hypothetical protein